MFVQIGMSGFDPAARRRIGATIRRAAVERLAVGPQDCFVHVLAGDALEEGARVAVLFHIGARLGEKTKRRLFGRVADDLERELGIARDDVLVGVAETPATNWTAGYARRLTRLTDNQAP